MATTAQDNLVRAAGFDLRKIGYAIDTTGSNDFHQGDLVWFDTTNNLTKALDTDAHAASFCGVALKSSFLSLYVNQNLLTATKIYEPLALVGIAGVFFFKTTAGETYKPGTVVYIGADAQTITTVAGSNSVGTVVLRQGQTSVTGASGTNVDILINVQFPVKSL